MGKWGRRLTPEEKREHSAYRAEVNRKMPKSKTLSQCIMAFLVGGAICCLGQLIGDMGRLLLSLDEKECASFVSVVLIFLSSLFTGIGLYDRLGAVAGAGSVVPITGFANSVVAPAMEHKREGLVMGVGAELFSCAGPVLVYGITSSIIVGVIAWLTTL